MKLSLDLSESFKIAMGALAANKSRGGLTALGIIIGIVAVITTMTAANGSEVALVVGNQAAVDATHRSFVPMTRGRSCGAAWFQPPSFSFPFSCTMCMMRIYLILDINATRELMCR